MAMNKKLMILGLTCGLAVSANLISQDRVFAQESPTIGLDLSADFNPSNWNSLNVNAGIVAKYQNFALSADVVTMTVLDGGSSGYYNQRFSNGRTVCRNASNGRFASSSSCSGKTNVDFSTFNQVDLTYALPTTNNSFLLLGGALDMKDTSKVYGVIGWSLEKRFYVKASIGQDTRIKVGATLFD
jgi:hypothetical protein